jgi:hypothetical protein
MTKPEVRTCGPRHGLSRGFINVEGVVNLGTSRSMHPFATWTLDFLRHWVFCHSSLQNEIRREEQVRKWAP